MCIRDRCGHIPSNRFVTFFYGTLDTGSGVFTYTNAGHNPPLLLSGGVGDDRLEELHPTGMALGILEDAPFQQQTVQMAPGELLLLYTDGVPDATQASGERFEMPRLRRLLLEEGSGTAQDVLSTLAGSVAAFTGTCEQFDDMAMVVTRRLAR